MSDRSAVAGVDVGGTFTDLVCIENGELVTAKLPSTPADQSEGVVDVLRSLDTLPQRIQHGTTVATNALLERKGAVTALVTTEGFEDVIEIGRQDRPSLYDPFADRPQSLESLRVGIAAVGPLTNAIDLGDAEAVAVSLMYGYANQDREEQVRQLIQTTAPKVPVSISSEVASEFREYERTSTTVVNAYLQPQMERYLRRLDASLVGEAAPQIAVMRSSGGLMALDEAASLPSAVLLSGPAAGVVAAAELAAEMALGTVIAFDMGGTSTDVSRIHDGAPRLTYERPVGGYPCRMASIDIHTVGAGGGSIAWRDAGGALRVGPHSAGAVPGPVCYGRGGDLPTVTDANVVLGRIAHIGDAQVDASKAEAALGELGRELGMSAIAAAHGVLTVVEENMSGAIRRVSVDEGSDLRGGTLVAFGGAGGLHASSVARRLGMAAAIVPPYSGVFSALGLLLSPPRVDVALTLSDAGFRNTLTGLEETAAKKLLATTGESGTISSFADVRYRGQSHEITLPVADRDRFADLAAKFHRRHHQLNGFARPTDDVEIVTVRAVATGVAALSWVDVPCQAATAHRSDQTRLIHLACGSTVPASVVSRDQLSPGDRVLGPAIIEGPQATTYVGDSEAAEVTSNGSIMITW